MYIVFVYHINEIFDIAVVLFNIMQKYMCSDAIDFHREFNVDGV